MEEINAWGAYETATQKLPRSLGNSLTQRRGQKKPNAAVNDEPLSCSIHDDVSAKDDKLNRSGHAIFFGTDDISTLKKTKEAVIAEESDSDLIFSPASDDEKEWNEICSVARDVFGVYFYTDESNSERMRSKGQNGHVSKIDGTMPWLSGWIKSFHLPNSIIGVLLFIEASLRGIAQVFFQNNPISGLFILVAMFIQSSRVAVHGVIAVVVGNLTGILMGFDKSFVSCGLFGYNSFLVGLAIATFYSPDVHDGYYWPVIIGVVVFAYFSSVLFIMLGKILAPYKTPPFTLPFNISTMAFLLAVGSMHVVEMGSVREPALPSYDSTDEPGALTARSFFAGAIRGIGQVYLANEIVSGVLVLVGIMICSRIAAFSAFLGSVIGTCVAAIVGVPSDDLVQGLYGFNPALTFSAMLMFYVPSPSSICIGVMASIITVFIQLALSACLEPYGLPPCTLPFCFGALAFIIIQGTTSTVISVPLSSMTTPEDHLKRVRRLSEGFDLLFSAIRATSHRKQLQKALSSLPRKRSSNVSKILEEYDEEVNGEQEKGFLARLFEHKPKQGVQRMQSFRFSIAVETPLFEDHEKESYTSMFDRMKDEGDYRASKPQFEAFLRSVGFNDEVGLDFACRSFQLLDLNNTGGLLDLDQWIAFTKISKQMNIIRRPIIKFFDFVDVNQKNSIEMEDLDSALSYLALPPLQSEDRERLETWCNAGGELEFEVIVNLVTIFKLRSIIKQYQKKRKGGLGFDESIHSALTN